ncbi:MAG: glutamate-5-semialdehyde dehydrogenase [Bacteroidota bacterium]
MNTEKKNQVLGTMISLLEAHQAELQAVNAIEVDQYQGGDPAMKERLIMNQNMVDGMIRSLEVVRDKEDPVGRERYQFQHPQGMRISDRTAPFGTVLIIYESRPDVTIEAAAIAFKAGNKILLKGGKEARKSNLKLVDLWHRALEEHGLEPSWISYLDFNRTQTQEFLKKPDRRMDLIVPRGGEQLIQFVKQHARVPVLVSGRGNNFIYVHEDADWEKVYSVLLNAKTHKISACNALDKVIFHGGIVGLSENLHAFITQLKEAGVQVWVDRKVDALTPGIPTQLTEDDSIWYEEFLDMKIVLGVIEDMNRAIDFINEHSGGHSIGILTENTAAAQYFMDAIDAGAVFHNVSTRFTDGGQFGLGAELAISTDKLHQRGPLGLEHLVTNKWYVYGEGQVRE